MQIKDTVREILIFLHLDLTKNLKYDRLSKQIMKRVILQDGNCIDIGCHKGEMLKLMIKNAPNGKHFAFEPIPFLFLDLKKKFTQNVSIFSYALSDAEGKDKFQLVKNALAYSGLQKRKYDISNPIIQEINVEKKRLDDIISIDTPIHFVKIDVEGGEFQVMKGAENILKTHQPTILFEFGKGASDFYGTTPEEMHDYVTNTLGLKIYTLADFLKQNPALSIEKFAHLFQTNDEYYFIAAKN